MSTGLATVVVFPLLGPLWVLSQPCRSCSYVVSCHVLMKLFYEQIKWWRVARCVCVCDTVQVKRRLRLRARRSITSPWRNSRSATSSVTSLRRRASARSAVRGWWLPAAVSTSESPSTTWPPRRRLRGQASGSRHSRTKVVACCTPHSERDWKLTSSAITWYVAEEVPENRWFILHETTLSLLLSTTRRAVDLFSSTKVCVRTVTFVQSAGGGRRPHNFGFSLNCPSFSDARMQGSSHA